MNDTGQNTVIARASARRSRRLSAIWLIPVCAIAIGAWLAWNTLSKEGPTITISFQSAEGLQAGQSQLKFKEIVLGTVKSLDLTPDHTRVLARVATTRQATSLLTDRTVFWVVRPRLFAGNLSGFDTLLSGAYIGMLPPQSAGQPRRQFVGLENPPLLEANVPGRTFLVKAGRLGSITLGSPVFYRDIDVGEVLGWDYGDVADNVTIRTFVRAPFDSYVHDESRFWNASGVSVKLGGAGVELQVESLRAILLGGIAFDNSTATTNGPGAVSPQNHVFPLFPDRAAAENASYSRKIPLVSYFPGSVRGLAPGSEVVVHGLMIGHVTSVRLGYDPVRDAIVAPVHFEVEPERIIGIGGKQVYATTAEAVDQLVKRGLRASLQSASLITGQQLVALDFIPNAPPATVTMDGSNFVLPTASSGGLADIQASAAELLANVDTIPFKRIGNSLNDILNSADQATSGPQMHKALTELAETVGSASALMQHLNTDAGPAIRQLPQMVAELQKTVANANRLLVSLDSGYGDNTRFNREVEQLLAQLTDAVSSIRSLADLLARHPEALVKGRPGGGAE